MRWLKYLWIPVSILLGILAWITLREQVPIPSPKREKEAIDAEAEARKMIIEVGTEQALVGVERAFKAELEALDERQKKQADALRARPDKLAAFLIRAAR